MRLVVGLAVAALSAWGSAAHAADAVKGGELYRTHCASCHSLDPAAPVPGGPHLALVIGRKAGAVEGFFYSQALKDSNIIWDETNLSAYLENPSALVPGTSMFKRMASEADRADIIAYLKTQQ